MTKRAAQANAVQGTGEERSEGVQDGTSNEHRNQQRSNASESSASVAGAASKQDSAVRSSLNIYEVAVLYHPDLEIDLEKATSKIEKIIGDSGGKVTNTDNWGKRKLTYPIKKLEYALYVFYTVEMPAEGVNKIEQTFNITDEIIRFLITRPDLKAKAKAEALAAEKAKKAAARRESEDKEDEESEEE